MGRVQVNVEPWPSLLCTQIRPPCSSTNFLATVNADISMSGRFLGLNLYF